MTIRLVMAILEDDRAQVLAIKQSIRAALPDCVLRMEEDGRSFLENLSNQPLPDLLILDLNVPVISGMEVLRKIRSRKDLDWMPVIIFSTDDSSKTRLEAKMLGANGFEVKPPLAKMGVVLKGIVEQYSYRGTDKPDRIEPLMHSSNPVLGAGDWGGVDDLIDDL